LEATAVKGAMAGLVGRAEPARHVAAEVVTASQETKGNVDKRALRESGVLRAV
jgi:hypothetical protein